MEKSQSGCQKRRVIILRHGERVDFAFGSSWTQYSFKDSNYVRSDLNMPEKLPPRESIDEWEKDSPLTTIGKFQANLVGESLKNFGVKFSKVFVSPSYRCLQTATAVITALGLENELPLNVDYGLFEWVGWYEGGIPKFLTEQERDLFFNVNKSYKPTMSRSELFGIENESLEEFYERNANATNEILSNFEGDILIVGHATNLDTCTRKLVGKEPRKKSDLRNLLMKVPYLAAIAMEQTGESSYQFIEPPCLTLTHNSCSNFDWKILDT